MKHTLLDAYTNFELAGISSLIIAIGDTIWLMKEIFHLPSFVYVIIFSMLITGIVLAALSIYRHHEKHWKLKQLKESK